MSNYFSTIPNVPTIVPQLTPFQQRELFKADLLGKFQRGDWHGVMDCAADLREHDAYHRGLTEAQPQPVFVMGFDPARPA